MTLSLPRASRQPNLERLNRLDALLGHLIEHPETAGRTLRYADGRQLGEEVHGFDLSQFAVRRGCGTAACACGWAGVERGFRAEGFELRLGRSGEGQVYYLDGLGSLSGFAAAQAFFGLTEREALWLFLPDVHPIGLYQTPADVRAQLRAEFGTDPTGVEPPIQF